MGWYAIFVESGNEEKVVRRLQLLPSGQPAASMHRLIIPKRRIIERKQGGRLEVEKNLFPGYILLQTDDIESFFWLSRGCPGLIRILRNKDVFQEIQPEEIQQILPLCDPTGIIPISIAIYKNQRLSVIQGPLCQKESLIHKLDKRKGRARIALVFNHQVHMVDLGIHIIPADF